MHATRPATGIGHARGMKPICVEHRRACNFASLSFPCFVDSLRTRACMHACMHAVATVVIRFAWRGRIRCFWISPFFFVSAIYPCISSREEGACFESRLIGDFFHRGGKVSICLVCNDKLIG